METVGQKKLGEFCFAIIIVRNKKEIKKEFITKIYMVGQKYN